MNRGLRPSGLSCLAIVVVIKAANCSRTLQEKYCFDGTPDVLGTESVIESRCADLPHRAVCERFLSLESSVSVFKIEGHATQAILFRICRGEHRHELLRFNLLALAVEGIIYSVEVNRSQARTHFLCGTKGSSRKHYFITYRRAFRHTHVRTTHHPPDPFTSTE